MHCKFFYSTPDDYVKKWCEVSRILPNGKMDVSISHFESPNDVIFRCCEILWVRADEVWMKKKSEPPSPLYPFELHFIDRYMLILIKNLKSDGSNNFGQTIGRISKALKKYLIYHHIKFPVGD